VVIHTFIENNRRNVLICLALSNDTNAISLHTLYRHEQYPEKVDQPILKVMLNDGLI